MSSFNKTETQIELWVKESLKNEKLTSLKVNITGYSEKGEGYLSDIVFATAVGTTENGDSKEYHLVVKRGKLGENCCNKSQVKLAFEKEAFIYEEVMSTFSQFQIQKLGQLLFKSFPKFYKSFLNTDREVIVLENLKKKEFYLHSRMQPMNLNHVKLVLKEYGKLHALSFAIRDQEPETFSRLTPNNTGVEKDVINAVFLETYKNIFNKSCKILEKQKKFVAFQKCMNIGENISYCLTELADKDDPQSVILHGDCWNNNFLFQYKEEDRNKPLDVSILDWQQSKLGSPVLDLSFFLYLCGSRHTLDNFDNLLKEYYTSFSTFLKQLGSDPNKLFSYASLKLHWKKYSSYGLVKMPLMLHFSLRSKADVPDVYDFSDLNSLFPNLGTENEDIYNERAVAVMEHFATTQP